jgi:hypothetical protein
VWGGRGEGEGNGGDKVVRKGMCYAQDLQ